MQPTCQMRALVRGVIPEGAIKPREIFWTTEARARHYIENRIAEPIVGPGERPAAGPQETKPQEPLEKKSSSAAPDGRSTASAASSLPGAALLSSALRVETASPRRKSRARKALETVKDGLFGSS